MSIPLSWAPPALVNQLLKLGRGAVVELGQNVGDPIDLRINNRLVGRGEVVVVEDRLAISITEMIQINRHCPRV